MSAEGSVESGAAEGRSPALERLFLSARHGVHTAANAAGRSASTAFNSAKESLESLRDSTHKTAGSLDKWAAAGVVSAIAAASAACAATLHTCGATTVLHSSGGLSSGCVHAGGGALQVGRTFRFKERSAKFTTELRAGLITFLMVRAACSTLTAVHCTIK